MITTYTYSHSKWWFFSNLTILTKKSWFAQLVTTIIFVSAWDKSPNSWASQEPKTNTDVEHPTYENDLFCFPSRLSRDSFEARKKNGKPVTITYMIYRLSRLFKFLAACIIVPVVFIPGAHTTLWYASRNSKGLNLRIIIGTTLTVLTLCRLWEAFDLALHCIYFKCVPMLFSKRNPLDFYRPPRLLCWYFMK